MTEKQYNNRLVVADSGWAESIPEWILEYIKTERIIDGFCRLLKPEKCRDEVGDAEIVAYLYTACLRHPISHELGYIYIYLASKLLAKKNGKDNLPEDFRKKLDSGLTVDEERELSELKRKLFNLRGGEIKSPLFDALGELKRRTVRKK